MEIKCKQRGLFREKELRGFKFWDKVYITDGCWNWLAYVDREGYGQFRRPPIYKAHRYAYEAVFGKIEAGKVLDHLCTNTRCVRPDHLEPVSSRENSLRGNTLAAKNFNKKYCPVGHRYDEINTWKDSKGKRKCRSCWKK